VQVIVDLKPPLKVSDLQMFLGMVVYFSALILFYAGIARPLFALLKKGVAWRWSREEHHAWGTAKRGLLLAPVLGHPIQGLPYRLYTDASNEAAGAALQQVQPIKVANLANTPAHACLLKAYTEGLPPPKLTMTISAKVPDDIMKDEWGNSLDETVVHVKRVIAYWSRLFKGAKTWYSATEREALAAKEGLVKFQPFIKGESILLVTNHAALQWAKMYKNTNQRLAAWRAVFAAYPGLHIVHRAGQVHSNVDPLSRLPRKPPEFIGPSKDPLVAISLQSAPAVAAWQPGGGEGEQQEDCHGSCCRGHSPTTSTQQERHPGQTTHVSGEARTSCQVLKAGGARDPARSSYGLQQTSD
jgi:hypothetical protein